MVSRFILRIVVGSCLLLSFCEKLQAQKNNFFVQLTPNLQQPLTIQESLYRNLSNSINWGASFAIGYHKSVVKNISVEAALGGSLYSFIYSTGKKYVQLNMPGTLNDKENALIHLRDYYYSYDFILQGVYKLKMNDFKHIGLGIGVKLIAIPDFGYEIGMGFSNSNGSVSYRLFDSDLDFKAGIKPTFIFSALFPVYKDKLELGIVGNIIPRPIAEGTFSIKNSSSNSSGTTKLYGSSIGINIRYNIR